MTDAPSDADDSARGQQLAEAIEEYYRRLRQTGSVDAEEFARDYPLVQSELLEFIEGLNAIAGSGDTVDFDFPHPLPHTAESLPERIRYFGDYELISEIARGGMGIVYRARQVSLDRLVAVKMILTGRLASELDVTRFRQEATAAAKLRHPHVITIFEIGEHEGHHFFSMEYVEGTNLAEVVRDNPLPAKVAAEYARTIAQTMADIHAAGLLHRDLKPSNVLIERGTGKLRIGDFGLAKSIDLDTLLTSTGQVLGTPSYMSPEQAAGHNQAVGPGADIYAIGAILYESITGRPPFVGETPWDTAWQVRNVEVVAPSALNHRVPRDLETICLKCLEKEIPRRYASAAELANELGRLLRGEPIQARPISLLERTWRWSRRNPALSSALGAAAVAFLGLLASLVVFANTQRHHAETLAGALDVSQQRLREGSIRLAESERDHGIRLCGQGDVDRGCLWLARSLATAPADAEDLRWSIRINLGAWQRELFILKGVFPGEGRAPTFSRDSKRFATSAVRPHLARVREVARGKAIGDPLPHDGTRLEFLFGADSSTLFIKSSKPTLWRESGGVWNTLAAAEVIQYPPLGHCIFTDENRLLTIRSQSNGLFVADFASGEGICGPLPDDAYDLGHDLLSPDGRTVLTHLKNHRAVLTDVASGEPIGVPLVHPERVQAAAFSPDGKRLATGYQWRDSTSQDVAQIQVWDAATGDKVGPPITHAVSDSLGLRKIAYNEAGDRLLGASAAETLNIWDSKGALIAGPLKHSSSNPQISMSADGRLLTYATPEWDARVWDVDAQETVGQALARMGTLHYVQIAPDGSHVLTGTPEEARLWQTPSRGRPSPPLTHGTVDPRFLLLQFSKNGERLLSTGYSDVTARTWDVRRFEPVGDPVKTIFGIQGRAISPDGRWVAVSSMQNMSRSDWRGILLWDAETGESPAQNLPQYEHDTAWIEFTSDAARLVTVGDRGKIYIYDVAGDKILFGPLIHPMHDFAGQRVSFAISPDNQRLAVYTLYEGPVSLWDLTTGQMIGEAHDPTGILNAIAFSPDSSILAVAGKDITLHDAQTGTTLPIEITTHSPASGILFTPDGKQLATTHEDRVVRLWNVATGEPNATTLEHSTHASLIAFAANGKLLLTATRSGGYLWDLASGTQVGPRMTASSMFALSPDQRLIAASAGRDIRFWEVPQPAVDDAAEAMRQIENATGFSLNDNRLIMPLEPNREPTD